MEKRKHRDYNGAVVCLQKYTLGQDVIIRNSSNQVQTRTNIPKSPACLGYFNRIDVKKIRDFRDYVSVTSKHEAEYPCSRKQLLLRRIMAEELPSEECEGFGQSRASLNRDEVILVDSEDRNNRLPFISDDGIEYALCCFSVFSINKQKHCNEARCGSGFYANMAQMLYDTMEPLRKKYDFRLSFMELLGTEDLCLIVLSNQYEAISDVIKALQCFRCTKTKKADKCGSCRIDNVHSILMMERENIELIKSVEWGEAKAEMHFSLHSTQGMHYLNTQAAAIRNYLKEHYPNEENQVLLESCSGEYDAFLRCPAHLLPIVLGLEGDEFALQGCFHPDNSIYRKRIYQSDTYLYPFGLVEVNEEPDGQDEDSNLRADERFLGAPKLRKFIDEAVTRLKQNLKVDDKVEDFVFQDLPIWRMLKEYWSFASFPMSDDLREDLEHQFLISVNAIVKEAELCGDDRATFVRKYDEIVTAMQASMQAGSQQDRWYFGEQQSYIENVDSYYKILRCYYGMLKDMIQLIYQIPRSEGTVQPYLVPMISFGVNPLIKSKFYESYIDRYVDHGLAKGVTAPAKLVCISLPYQALSNPLKYLGVLAHEIFHYAAPSDRGTRNDLMMEGLVRIAISEFISILAKNCQYPGNEDVWDILCSKDETFRKLIDKVVDNAIVNLYESCDIDRIRLRDIRQMVEHDDLRFTLDPSAQMGYDFYQSIWVNLREMLKILCNTPKDQRRQEFAHLGDLNPEFLELYQDMFDLKPNAISRNGKEEPGQLKGGYRAKMGQTKRTMTLEFRRLMLNAYKAMVECPPDIFDLEVVMYGKSPEEKIHQFLWQQFSAKRDLLMPQTQVLQKNNIRAAMVISFYLNESYDNDDKNPHDTPAHLKAVLDRWIKEGFKDTFDIARKAILADYEKVYLRFRWLFGANRQICSQLANRIRTQQDGTSPDDSIKVRLTRFYESYYQILSKFQNAQIDKIERHDMLFGQICALIDTYQNQKHFEVHAPTSAQVQKGVEESTKPVKFTSAADDDIRFTCNEHAFNSSDLLYKLSRVCERMKVNEKLPMLWYRGQPRKEWPTLPNIMRLGCCKSPDPDSEGFAQFLRYQKQMAQARILPTGENLSDAEWLAFLQHYGFKTNTLDFSESIVPALYFATEQWVDKADSCPNTDAVVMVFNPVLFNLAMELMEKTELLEDILSVEDLKAKNSIQELDQKRLAAKKHLMEQQKKNASGQELEKLEQEYRILHIERRTRSNADISKLKEDCEMAIRTAEEKLKRYLETGISYEQPSLFTASEVDQSLSHLYDLPREEEFFECLHPRAVMVPRHCDRMDKQLGEFVYYNISSEKTPESITDKQQTKRIYSYSSWSLERLHEKYVQYCKEKIREKEAETGEPNENRFVPFLSKIVINRYRYQGFKRCVQAMRMQRFSVYPEYDKLAEDLKEQLNLY